MIFVSLCRLPRPLLSNFDCWLLVPDLYHNSFAPSVGTTDSQYSMHLHRGLFHRQSTGSSLDNRVHPMENVGQASDLEGIQHEMHGIAEQIKMMNEINAHLVQHPITNNMPPVTACIPKNVGQSRHSHRSGNRDLQNCQSASQGCYIRSRRC